jgi:S1-C subfamily serine protease
MKPSALAPVLLMALAASAPAQSKKEKDVRRSVVRVFAVQRLPDLFKPWNKKEPHEVAGSGFIVEGDRVLTNAHLVLYAKQIYLQPYESSERFPAKVVRMASGLDMAVLVPDDPTFFRERPALSFAADLPDVKDAVIVYGYPVGGPSLGITRGIVSRVAYGPCSSHESGLLIQVDAALNPGNSGGPVLVNDRVVGIVFSLMSEGQNIGYVIANEEIKEVLRADGKEAISSKPKLLDTFQALQNDALRASIGLPRATTGVFVNTPFRSDSAYPLKRGDVITRVGSYAIDNDGMVTVKENLRLACQYLIAKLARDECIRLTVWRKGKSLDIDVPVVREPRWLVRRLDGRYPSYFVYGPLVFSPTSPGMADAILSASASIGPLMARRYDLAAFDDEELVLVTALLPHKTSKGYNDPAGQVVSRVNGTLIRNLRHLIEVLRASKVKFIEFEFADKYVETLVFDREELLSATDDILSDNGIRQQCSPDLRAVWEARR